MSELESAPDLISNLAYEYAERWRRGERPELIEYTERYPDLAEQIRELFPALVMMEQFGSVAGQSPERNAASAAVPRQLGEHRILREIGRGGMGIVYEAVQESLGRHVALKVLPLHHLLGATHLERFEREAKAAARLHHTNIVPVFGIGVHEGVHYYAMQFIQGQAIDAVLEEVRRQRAGTTPVAPAARSSPLTASIAQGLLTDVPAEPRAALPAATTSGNAASGTSELTGPSEAQYFRGVARLGVQVAEALAYAHRQGIVHRDIKPSNLLLDTQGIAWITDFGLVKDESGSNLTSPGDIVGTIRYMAAERFEDAGDARSDIYSLGATLYEMLTLAPAFPGEQRAALIERVRNEEPRRPRQLDGRIPRDLETVVLKAMAKEPGRRYQDAAALAEDLRRFLADRPVLARRTAPTEQVWRWCRRNPLVAILAASVVLLLAVLLAGALVSNGRLQEQLERAERAEQEKTDKLWDSYLASARANRFSAKVGRRFAGLEAVRRAAALRPDLSLRNEAVALFMLADIRIARDMPNALPEGSKALTFDADFERYARSDAQGNISVRRVADDREIVRLPGFGTYAWHMAFSPDGRFLAVRYHFGGQLRIWDVAQAQVVLAAPICGAADFSASGNLVALAKADGLIHLVDLTTGQVAKRLPAGPKTSVWYNCAFEPHGRMLAVSGGKNTRIFDLDSGKVLHSLDQPGEVAWQAGGVLLAVVNPERITVWNTRTWTHQVAINTPASHTNSACCDPTGELLASTGWDETLQLWHPGTGQHLLSRHGANRTVQFSRTGRLLAMTHEGARVQLWEVASPRGCRVLAPPRAPNQGTWVARFSPENTLLACSGAGGMSLWDLATGCNVATLPSGPTSGAVFTADGNSVITRGSAGLLRWPVHADPGVPASLRVGPPQLLLKTSPAQIPDALCPGFDGKIALNLREGKPRILFLDPRDPTNSVAIPAANPTSQCLAVSPDGRWVAAMSGAFERPATLQISDARTGAAVWSHPARTPGEFSSDSRWLVTGGDATRIWETGTWRLAREIPTPAGLGTVYHASFSPDGRVLALAYEGLVARLVDAQTGEELATLPSHAGKGVESVRFSPDGTLLACVNGILGTQLWDLRQIRSQLDELSLDWGLPPYPPRADDSRREPIRVQVVATDPTPTVPSQR